MVPLSEAIAVHLLYLRRQRANVTATWLWFSTTMCDELFVVVPFIMIFSLRMVKHWDLKLSTWFPFIYLLWKNNITKIDSSLVSCLKHGFRLVKTGFGLQLWSMPVGLWLSAARASTSWWTIGLWRLVLEQPWENKSFREKNNRRKPKMRMMAWHTGWSILMLHMRFSSSKIQVFVRFKTYSSTLYQFSYVS